MNILLTRILAKLTQIWRNAEKEVSQRFRIPYGPLVASNTFKATVWPTTANWVRFCNQNPLRYALIVSAPVGTTARIWPNAEAGASGGISVPTGSWDTLLRMNHGDLVGSDWYVLSTPGAGTFSFIEVF